jgi:hypothetical protein
VFLLRDVLTLDRAKRTRSGRKYTRVADLDGLVEDQWGGTFTSPQFAGQALLPESVTISQFSHHVTLKIFLSIPHFFDEQGQAMWSTSAKSALIGSTISESSLSYSLPSQTFQRIR